MFHPIQFSGYRRKGQGEEMPRGISQQSGIFAILSSFQSDLNTTRHGACTASKTKFMDGKGYGLWSFPGLSASIALGSLPFWGTIIPYTSTQLYVQFYLNFSTSLISTFVALSEEALFWLIYQLFEVKRGEILSLNAEQKLFYRSESGKILLLFLRNIY